MSGGAGDDSPISIVEDLDPEPDRGKEQRWWRSPRWGEVILGLLLLFGVIAWAGYTWWQDESNSSNYQQGLQAESLRGWDQALAHFSSARGYKDADARAAQASRQIEERDTQYESAKSHEQAGDATQTLLATLAVQAIQPGYKDVDEMARQAQEQAYTDVLSASVVMRTSVSPQGLYYRGAGGWVYLQDSDQWSSVLSVPFSGASAKRIVYDVPGPNWNSRSPLNGGPFNPYEFQITQGLADKVGRRLRLAILPDGAGSPQFESLQLDPTAYSFYICGEAGVWGIKYTPRMPDPVMAKGFLDGFVPTYEQVPQPSHSPADGALSPVAMPGADGVIADFGHKSTGEGDSLLLAAHAAGENKGTTQLSLARAGGSDPHTVFSTTGVLVSALLSPDDRHALVVASDPVQVGSADKQLVSAILLTLDGTAPPRLLQKITVDIPAGSSGGYAAMADRLTISGVFLERGAFSNTLLLGWADSDSPAGIKMRLLDVTNPDRVLADASMPYEQVGVLAVLEQADGCTLLLYNQGVPPEGEVNGAPAAQVEVMRAEDVAGNIEVNSYNVPLPESGAPADSTPYLMNPALHGDDLIYSVETFTTQPETSSIYRLRLPATDDRPPANSSPPSLIFSNSWSSSQANGKGWPAPRVAGPGAYGYVDLDGTLHADAYGADADASLERGIGNIFALNANYFYKVLH